MAYTYEYPRPAVTADCVVMTKEDVPQVLLVERGNEPYKGCWALPGGFMNMDETTEQCAFRELKEETGLDVQQVWQIGAYSKLGRDPRGRNVCVAYLAIVDTPAAVSGQSGFAKILFNTSVSRRVFVKRKRNGHVTARAGNNSCAFARK